MLEIVWLVHERTFGRLVKLGTYYSEIEYTQAGIDYDVLVDNDDFTILEGSQDDSDNE